MVAASAGLLYLCLLPGAGSRNGALLLTVAYGLGTAAWSTASQGMWQHGPGMLCLAIEDDSDGYPPHILQAVADDKPLNSSGTGLGLRFASLIAKAHKNDGRTGSLHLRNQDGAVFEIRVP